MARPKTETQERLSLDRVERRKLAELRGLVPEYSDLKLTEIAHIELKEVLFSKVRESLKNPSIATSPMGPWVIQDSMGALLEGFPEI